MFRSYHFLYILTPHKLASCFCKRRRVTSLGSPASAPFLLSRMASEEAPQVEQQDSDDVQFREIGLTGYLGAELDVKAAPISNLLAVSSRYGYTVVAKENTAIVSKTGDVLSAAAQKDNQVPPRY